MITRACLLLTSPARPMLARLVRLVFTMNVGIEFAPRGRNCGHLRGFANASH